MHNKRNKKLGIKNKRFQLVRNRVFQCPISDRLKLFIPNFLFLLLYAGPNYALVGDSFLRLNQLNEVNFYEFMLYMYYSSQKGCNTFCLMSFRMQLTLRVIGCVQQNIYFAAVGNFVHTDWVMLLDRDKINDPISGEFC